VMKTLGTGNCCFILGRDHNMGKVLKCYMVRCG
jgi:hypothetical protein